MRVLHHILLFALGYMASTGWAATRLTFDDLPLGSRYGVGDVFTTSNVVCSVEPFYYYPSGSTTNGRVSVSSNAPPYLFMGNANLRVHLSPAQSLSLSYGAYGGNLNLRVNGVFTNVLSISSLHNKYVGGVLFQTIPVSSVTGVLGANGIITNFAIGGQEFMIDNLAYTEVPRPLLQAPVRDAQNNLILPFQYPGTDTNGFTLRYAHTSDSTNWLMHPAANFTNISANQFQVTAPWPEPSTNLFLRVHKVTAN